jgi:hypothetical protein
MGKSKRNSEKMEFNKNEIFKLKTIGRKDFGGIQMKCI